MDEVGSGWERKKVRNRDGRTGVIEEADGFAHWLDLHIRCDDGTKAVVKMNARGQDGGDPGWQWWCESFGSAGAWLPLGDLGAPMADLDGSEGKR